MSTPIPLLAELSAEEKRVLIAEKCGYEWFKFGNPPDEANRFMFKGVPAGENYGSMLRCQRPSHGIPELVDALPKYLTDLNACHEAEASLQWTGLLEWERQLEQICWYRDGEVNDGRTALIRATAAQRCDALLLCLGLAREGGR